ncbi:acyl-CoA-binding domain-containing protein 6 [Octopus bimaculoides]|uniref:Acyl-CoA-binding domain-containing protein 6 n=1 Tax=Octopus bimaculoides TaxID=37653 RepID=A0A0L8IDI6_OCTBM|nr:acyl-CoA-binding domain-containing protein 6 [Octopus bimaculoides]|eukprot:XP_014774609.1 PREDICTED: acyl-CoA-binding domain-containing protein 6-like [Octopus bimaculoides]
METEINSNLQKEDSLCLKFNKAAHYIRQYGTDLGTKKMLYFYARYKQANEGQCHTPKPGMLQFEAKQKWEAWKSLGKMNKKEAMSEYICEVQKLYPNWEDAVKDEDSFEDPYSRMSRRTLSKLCSAKMDVDSEIGSWTIFDMCKEGKTKELQKTLETGAKVNDCDNDGMTLLHWACDRGYEDIVDVLLKWNCDVNVKATDGQTPLHYAASCEYESIVQKLLENHADPSMKCNEGETPADATDNKLILTLLSSKGS